MIVDRPIKLTLTLYLVFFVLPCLCLADWPNWRGPNFDGSAKADESYPTYFNKKDGVKWVLSLDGPSASTPIVTKNRVFLSGARVSNDKATDAALLALCIDRGTGKIIWSKYTSVFFNDF